LKLPQPYISKKRAKYCFIGGNYLFFLIERRGDRDAAQIGRVLRSPPGFSVVLGDFS
jgi:hypothetical protein